MSAAEALEAAKASGICVSVEGDDLFLEAPAPPPSTVLDLLTRSKTCIVALLRPADEGWSAEDWQGLFDERAGIAEFDGGLPRGQAEVCAFAFCVAEWLNRNRSGSPTALEGAEVWLHGRCRPNWDDGRLLEAVRALGAIGIPLPTELPDDFGKNGGA